MASEEIPFTATLCFTPKQIEELIKKYIQLEYGFECDVAFKCHLAYHGQMDRGPGTPELQKVECIVKNGSLKTRKNIG
jgi:hypothetical protein